MLIEPTLVPTVQIVFPQVFFLHHCLPRDSGRELDLVLLLLQLAHVSFRLLLIVPGCLKSLAFHIDMFLRTVSRRLQHTASLTSSMRLLTGKSASGAAHKPGRDFSRHLRVAWRSALVAVLKSGVGESKLPKPNVLRYLLQ